MTAKKIVSQILLVLVAAAIGGAGAWYWLAKGPGNARPAAEKRGAAETKKQQYTCAMHPFVVSDKPGNCPICGMTLVPIRSDSAAATGPVGEKKERKVKYWVAPMDPSYRSDKPGKSPMGMDLVPVYEDNGGEEGTVRVDPNTIQSIGVRTVPVTTGELKKTIRTVGRIAYDESRITSVNSKVNGWIEKLYVDITGQEVRKGQPLIDIYSPDLVSAQQEYLIARGHIEKVKDSPFPDVVKSAQEMLASARKRLDYWDINDAQIGKLERTGEVRKTLTLYSPFHGVVVSKSALEGGRVMMGMELFRIADISRIWVQADVYEYELPWVKPGTPATVTLDYLPGRAFHGKVSYVYPYLDGKTRTATARIELVNPGIALKPDMFAHVELAPRVAGKTVLIPSDAVIRSGIRNVVFIDKGEGRFQPREVSLGLEGEEGTVQVLSGLSGGERIVVSAQFLLDSESNLKEALKKFQGGAAGGPAGPATPSSAPPPSSSPPSGGTKNGSSMKGMDMGGATKGTVSPAAQGKGR
ncbi:MAG: efflux RND transporter periplasmic adaptor subunit [Actinomycetota bacterium]